MRALEMAAARLRLSAGLLLVALVCLVFPLRYVRAALGFISNHLHTFRRFDA